MSLGEEERSAMVALEIERAKVSDRVPLAHEMIDTIADMVKE